MQYMADGYPADSRARRGETLSEWHGGFAVSLFAYGSVDVGVSRVFALGSSVCRLYLFGSIRRLVDTQV